MSVLWCGSCNQEIQGGSSFTSYAEKSYHDKCFSCTECRRPLGSLRFCFRDNRPYCVNDFDKLFGKNCKVCGGLLEGPMLGCPEGGFLHVECLTCSRCNKEIGAAVYPGKYYCTPECKRAALASPHPASSPQPKPAPSPAPAPSSPFAVKIKVKNDVCSACDKECYAMDKMEMMNKMWHKRCFKCPECKVMLSPHNYVGVDGMPYCRTHAPRPQSTPMAL